MLADRDLLWRSGVHLQCRCYCWKPLCGTVAALCFCFFVPRLFFEEPRLHVIRAPSLSKANLLLLRLAALAGVFCLFTGVLVRERRCECIPNHLLTNQRKLVSLLLRLSSSNVLLIRTT